LTIEVGRVKSSYELEAKNENKCTDRFRRRGENISSLEIEQVLLTYPSITECAVVRVRVEGAGGKDE
jgi:carnitine-CoA ligase